MQEIGERKTHRIDTSRIHRVRRPPNIELALWVDLDVLFLFFPRVRLGLGFRVINITVGGRGRRCATGTSSLIQERRDEARDRCAVSLERENSGVKTQFPGTESVEMSRGDPPSAP